MIMVLVVVMVAVVMVVVAVVVVKAMVVMEAMAMAEAKKEIKEWTKFAKRTLLMEYASPVQ